MSQKLSDKQVRFRFCASTAIKGFSLPFSTTILQSRYKSV